MFLKQKMVFTFLKIYYMMVYMNFTAHENLAKLMSTEDIGVTYGNTETAYFNTETRTLMIPNWVGLKDIELQMLIAHEIGHALFTPYREWKDAILENQPSDIFKDYLNVVEDARIEKLVKKKYPGSKKIFFFGYKELLNRKNVLPKNLNQEFNLIDTINLHFKLIGIHDFKLDEIHQYFINKMEKMESFLDALEIAQELFLFTKEHKRNQSEIIIYTDDISKELEEDEDSSSESTGYSENTGNKLSNDKSKGASLGKSDKDSKNKTMSGKYGAKGSKDSKEPEKSITSSIIEESLKNIRSNKKIYTANPPEPILENIIRPYKKVLDDFDTTSGYISSIAEESSSVEEDDEFADLVFNSVDIEELTKTNSLNTFMKKNSNTISYHKQLFEMRKKAIEHNRTMTFRSGLLDMNKVYSYKYEDQIFKTFQIKESGKKHGLIFFLDMSGSMHGYIKGAITKMLEIVLFCRAAQIPYTVYGFTTAIFEKKPKFRNYGTMEYKMSLGEEFTLIELLTSSMTSIEFKKGFDILYKMIGTRHAPSSYQLHGTPLNETILCLDQIVKNFKNETNAQIVNVVFFTDGFGGPYVFTPNNSTQSYYNSVIPRSGEWEYNEYVIYDRKTKTNFSFKHDSSMTINDGVFQSKILLNMMRVRMKNTNILNYYITNDFWSMLETKDLQNLPGELSKIKKESPNNYNNYRLVNSYFQESNNIVVKDKLNGFDQGYLIHTNFFKKKPNSDKKKEENVDITKEFQDNVKNRKMSNKLISDFINMIV